MIYAACPTGRTWPRMAINVAAPEGANICLVSAAQQVEADSVELKQEVDKLDFLAALWCQSREACGP